MSVLCLLLYLGYSPEVSYTKKIEDKYQAYYFLIDYLCRSAEKLNIELPLNVANYAAQVGDRDSMWGKSINAIIEETREYDISDEEIPEEYSLLQNSIIVAFSELQKWARNNRLYVGDGAKSILKIDYIRKHILFNNTPLPGIVVIQKLILDQSSYSG